MSNLRSVCIEAMAQAIDVPGDRTDAEAALDALLGVLEEHAVTTVHGAFGNLALQDLYLEELLAVLREDT